METSEKILLAGLGIIAIGGIVYYFNKSLIGEWLKKTFAKTEEEKEEEKREVPKGCTFPVSVESSPECVYYAFEKSGYLNELKTAVDMGVYPSSYLESAKKYPIEWLKLHPYLYDVYPQYFKRAGKEPQPPVILPNI